MLHITYCTHLQGFNV